MGMGFLKTMKLPPSSSALGLTLLETLVTLAVLAALAQLALPDFSAVFSQGRVAAAANRLHRAVALARTAALTQGQSHHLRVREAESENPWGDGYALLGATEIPLRVFPAEPLTIVERSGGQALTFSPQGRLATGAIFTLCPSFGPGLELTVALTGRVSQAPLACD